MLRKLAVLAAAALAVSATGAHAQDLPTVIANAACADGGAHLRTVLETALGAVVGCSIVANFRSRIPAPAMRVIDVLALNFWRHRAEVVALVEAVAARTDQASATPAAPVPPQSAVAAAPAALQREEIPALAVASTSVVAPAPVAAAPAA